MESCTIRNRETYKIRNRFTGEIIHPHVLMIDWHGCESARECVVDAVKCGVSLSEADLRGIDLSGVDLSGVDLSGSSLMRADLTGTDLRGSNLMSTIIEGSNYWDAKVSERDIMGAILKDSNVRYTHATYNLPADSEFRKWVMAKEGLKPHTSQRGDLQRN